VAGRLAGKGALVTGGGRGIGQAIAQALAAEGAPVAIADWDEPSAKQTAEELNAQGHQALGFKADVTQATQMEEVVKQTLEAFGNLTILVNNAGITKDNLVLRMSEEDWDRVLDVNLKGVFITTKAVVRSMLKQRDGRIVNIASVVGLIGNAGQANYSSSKAGIIGFTKSAAREFASRHVRVNAIAPGFIETAMTEALDEEARARLITQIPLPRLGTPDDVAAAVVFLVSDAAAYVTGHVLHVDGGMAM
jgi:3-oxoacyl-[acyl-carrier protein] reductase